MTIKQLRDYLETIPIEEDHRHILRPVGDHGYAITSLSFDDVTENRKERRFFEYYGDEHLEENEHKVKALIAI